ncbi:transposase [Streptomyces sp. PKU-EA00015]|uniref:transposase n=1 Tax=Streptomyces sp. PKU-EA00015 TaxID=2748326 RepID=UPI0035C82269
MQEPRAWSPIRRCCSTSTGCPSRGLSGWPTGRRRVHLVTADERARACPACGVFATRVKGSAVTRPRDLPYGESGLEFPWHKRRWWCREADCPRRSFTEQIPQIPAGARLTTRLRGAAGRRIRDAGSTVIQAARDLHLSWPTAMEAFRTQARDVTEAPLPRVAVLGIDETRRGRPRWEQDADTDKWHLTRDQWHTGFVDALGHGGLLGQVEGRTIADVLAWLATTDLDWRKGIGYVAIDMSATYRAAIHIGLPHATVVVDHFHVVQLADKMLSMVMRRTTAETRGRRGGRATRSGRPDGGFYATARTSPTTSSPPCGSPSWARGRSGRRC